MSATRVPAAETLNTLRAENLAPVCLRSDEASARQIATHLRSLLRENGAGNPMTVQLPSSVELAALFHREVLDVLDALLLLSNEHFTYRMNGLDREIMLCDPLNRRSRQNSWARTAIELIRSRGDERNNAGLHA